MFALFRTVILLVLSLLFCGWSVGCGSGGLHLPRPDLYATRATIDPARPHPSAVAVELLAENATDGPLWLRRLDITLASQGADLAAGIWDGNRLIDPDTSVLLVLSLPLLESGASPATLPTTDTPGTLHITTHYARSGILGLMGGESFTYELPVVIRAAD